MKNLGAHYPTVTFAFLSLPLSCSLSVPALYFLAAAVLQNLTSCLPARASEHYESGGKDFKRSLHGPNGDGLSRLSRVGCAATQVLKHLPVEHGRLSLTGDLIQPCSKHMRQRH